MKVYIVWSKDSTLESPGENVIGVYKRYDDAVSKMKTFAKKNAVEFNEEIDNDEDDDTLVCNFSGNNSDDTLRCRVINIDCVTLYFCKISERGGGQSYHSDNNIYACLTEDEAVKCASDYFFQEHNRDDGCKKCTGETSSLDDSGDDSSDDEPVKKKKNKRKDSSSDESSSDDSSDYSDNESNKKSSNNKQSECYKEMMDDLKKTGYACIECTDYEGADIKIWKMKVN